MACAILERTSGLEPSSETTAPRYLNMIRSRKMLKRVGDRKHLCLTPIVVLNHSPMLPFIWTALVALS